ncbi:membrane-bound lytic murein transglycosylase A precursor [mine drainage metagenome]|uniref:peptidoglycan lytic exotransglycosylase n=1 Tax=mine drainage metagenome TaxID=410659 RepID=A0A1J5QMT7_9ZZZZ
MRRLRVLLPPLLLLAGCAAPSLPPAETPPPMAAPPAAASAAAPGTPTTSPVPIGLKLHAVGFDALPGWSADDFAGVWSAWRADCTAPQPTLTAACTASRAVPDDDRDAQRAFFMQWFQPWQADAPGGASSGLVTGYFEPVYDGSLQRSDEFPVPVYGAPADLVARPDADGGVQRGRVVDGHDSLQPYWSRAQIGADAQLQAALARHAVAWLHSPLDALFLQIQGSGLLRLPDGSMLRLSYAGDNGWPYRSVGRWLLDHGKLRGTVTMQIIRAWAELHPDEVQTMLDANPRVVFFRASPLPAAAGGPRGALGVPLTALRSVAVDRSVLPLGTALWLDTTQGGRPLQRLVFAQDVGGAIKGPLRADLFFGTGVDAGDSAGRMQSPGRFWLLLPRATPAPAASTAVAAAH